jgi:hypothetical protein
LGLGLSLDPEAVYLAGVADWAGWAVPSAHFTPFLAGRRSEELRRGGGLSAEAAERVATLLLLRAGRGSGDGAQAGGFAAGFAAAGFAAAGFAGGLERLRGGIAKVESGIWE